MCHMKEAYGSPRGEGRGVPVPQWPRIEPVVLSENNNLVLSQVHKYRSEKVDPRSD